LPYNKLFNRDKIQLAVSFLNIIANRFSPLTGRYKPIQISEF
jgi:hypothetical protein